MEKVCDLYGNVAGDEETEAHGPKARLHFLTLRSLAERTARGLNGWARGTQPRFLLSGTSLPGWEAAETTGGERKQLQIAISAVREIRG